MNRAFVTTMMKSVFGALVAATAFSAVAADAPASASASASAPAAAAPAAPDAAKGATLYGTTCVSCHGDGGNAPIAGAPKLASQHAAYLIKQLSEFKSGARKNSMMAPMATNLSDEDMRNVAAYLNTQQLKPGAAKNKDTVELGKKIFRAGIKEKNVPACNGCHGPAGAGIPAQYARIGGQNQDYVLAQLKGFSDGTRANNTVMATIAARMSSKELEAVSDYVAGLR